MRKNSCKVLCWIFSLLLILNLNACKQNEKNVEFDLEAARSDVQEYLSAFVNEEAMISRFEQTRRDRSETQIEVSCTADYTDGTGNFCLIYTLENGIWALEKLEADLTENKPAEEAEKKPEQEEPDKEMPAPEEDMSVDTDPPAVEEKAEDSMITILTSGYWYQYIENGYECMEYQFHADQTISVRVRDIAHGNGDYTSNSITMSYSLGTGGQIKLDKLDWIYDPVLDQIQSEYWDDTVRAAMPIYLEHYQEVPSLNQMEKDSQSYRTSWVERYRSLVQDEQIDDTYALYLYEPVQLECYYPKHFLAIPTDNLFGIRKYEDEETGQTVEFCYQELTDAQNAEHAMQSVLDANSNMKVHMAVSGESWYVVSLESDNGYYYRKAIFRGNNMRVAWFDFYVPKTVYTRYNDYIEYMEDHFSLP